METLNRIQCLCPPPSLDFTTIIPNQDTISSPSQPHIQLHCNTFSHLNYVTSPDGNSMLESTYNKYDLHLHNNNLDTGSLLSRLIESEIPERHHQRILESILHEVEIEAKLKLKRYRNKPLPLCLLSVCVTCHKFYSRVQNNHFERPIDDGGMVPATEESIRSMLMNTMQLPNDGIIDNVSKSCPICLHEFLDYGGTLSSLGCMPCNHIFHRQCIVDWLRKSHYCPLCRFEMPTSTTSQQDLIQSESND